METLYYVCGRNFRTLHEAIEYGILIKPYSPPSENVQIFKYSGLAPECVGSFAALLHDDLVLESLDDKTSNDYSYHF